MAKKTTPKKTPAKPKAKTTKSKVKSTHEPKKSGIFREQGEIEN